MRKKSDSVLDPSEVNEDGTRPVSKPNDRHVMHMVPKNRIFQRLHGCRNCRNFDQGPTAVKFYQESNQRDARILLERGRSLTEVNDIIAGKDRRMKPPLSGICIIGAGGPADFKDPRYICDRYVTKLGVDAGRINVTPEELYAKLGEDP